MVQIRQHPAQHAGRLHRPAGEDPAAGAGAGPPAAEVARALGPARAAQHAGVTGDQQIHLGHDCL